MALCTILSPQWLYTALDLGGSDGNPDLRVGDFSVVKNSISLKTSVQHSGNQSFQVFQTVFKD